MRGFRSPIPGRPLRSNASRLRPATWRAIATLSIGFAFSLILPLPASAAVRLHGLFTDNMILQQGMSVPVWGDADPGEAVAVAIAGQTQVATAGPDGRWAVRLNPLKAGGPFTLTIIGKSILSVRNIAVGEVWLCSGQSNMEMSVANAANAAAAIPLAEDRDLRLFMSPHLYAARPQTNIQGRWRVATPSSVRGFSATAYYFGRALRRALGVPVGLIDSSLGGTRAQLWTPESAMEADPALQAMVESWKRHLPARPQPSVHSGYLYNGMIAPLAPFSLRGVAWYQGESDTLGARRYAHLLPRLIASWREAWVKPDLPFLIVQLPNYGIRSVGDHESGWAEVRDVQRRALSLPDTGLVVTIDLGGEAVANLHPKDKQSVGARLARLARAMVYSDDVTPAGPLFAGLDVEGAVARVHFEPRTVGAGLEARGGLLQGFSIAGAQGPFVPANAKIEGDTVVVSSPVVPRPAAVRYAWANNPLCSLYNRDRLPASPFTSEDWTRDTARSARR